MGLNRTGKIAAIALLVLIANFSHKWSLGHFTNAPLSAETALLK